MGFGGGGESHGGGGVFSGEEDAKGGVGGVSGFSSIWDGGGR